MAASFFPTLNIVSRWSLFEMNQTLPNNDSAAFRVERLSPNIGAILHDIDLREKLDNTTRDAIYQALLDVSPEQLALYIKEGVL